MAYKAKKVIPVPITPHRWSRNSGVPLSQIGSRVLHDYNYVLSSQRKLIASFNGFSADFPAGSEERKMRFWFRSGKAASGLKLQIDMICGPNATGLTDPYLKWTLTDEGALTSEDSAEVHFNLPSGGWSGEGPSSLGYYTVTFDIDATTEYSGVCKTFGTNCVSACIYEVHPKAYDETSNAAPEPGTIASGQPILTTQAVDIFQDGHALWLNNGATFFSWATNSNNVNNKPGRTSATAANAFDQSLTSFTSGDPGFIVQPRYSNPEHTDNVTCIFAACGRMATGTADGTVTLRDSSGTLATLSSFAQAASGGGEWKQTTCNLDGSSNLQELQVYIAGDGTDVFYLEACTLYMYAT